MGQLLDPSGLKEGVSPRTLILGSFGLISSSACLPFAPPGSDGGTQLGCRRLSADFLLDQLFSANNNRELQQLTAFCGRWNEGAAAA